MKSHLTRNALLAASVVLLTAGCATQDPPPPHVHRGVAPSPPRAEMMGMDGGMRMEMNQHMDMMKQMHGRMAAARSDAERQALMSEHMQMMQAMMESMKKRMDSMPAR